MSLKSQLRPLHMQLRQYDLYEELYLRVRSKAREKRDAAERKVVAAKMSAVRRTALLNEGKASVVHTVMDTGDYVSAERILEVLLADPETATSSDVWEAKANFHLAQGQHAETQEVARDMILKNLPIGHYYIAKSFFAQGDYAKTMQHIQACLFAHPNHADCIYLLADLAMQIQKPAMAQDLLQDLVETTNRPKSWLSLANLVATDEDFLRMQKAWNHWHAKDGKGVYNKDSAEYLALGAMRVDNYPLAKEIWRNSLTRAASVKGGFQSLKVRKPSYSSDRAETALADLNSAMRAAEIEMFLVSGTLLGCVRENKLLGHDKDIDVGIWSDVTADVLSAALNAAGKFLPLASRSEHIVRLKHLNGIAIDIFYHYRDLEDYWHAGVKMKWSNTPFKLVSREFLGQEHLIPEDYDTYLQENYGDWHTPKIAFDSAFDTPNGTILHKDEMVIHAFKGLQNACISGTQEAIALYLQDLQGRGEGAFVTQFCKHLKKVDPITAQLCSV